MIPTRYCYQCGEEDHGSVGCHAQWFQEVEKQIRELEKEATVDVKIERVGWGYRVKLEKEDLGLWSEEKMTKWERGDE